MIHHGRPRVRAADGGFVLLDPARLEALVPDARGTDLLEALMTTDLGDEVARTGVAVPLLGVDPGAYDLLVLDEGTDPGELARHGVDGTPQVSAGGFVLQTVSGELLLDPLSALRCWDPGDPAHGRLRVPPGSYAVELRGHLPRPDAPAGLAGSYCWVLRASERPWFSADA